MKHPARTEIEAIKQAGVELPPTTGQIANAYMTRSTFRRAILTLRKPVTPEWLRAQAAEFRADGSSDLYRLAAEYEERADALEDEQRRV